MRELELYLHIPFCVQKCKYCDFLSAPAGEGERQAYVDSLCGKIRSYRDTAKAYHVVSIFVGGGTPSILTGQQVLAIFRAVRETFAVDADAEITLEVNPATVAGAQGGKSGPENLSREKLEAWRQAGVNRLSIGLQSAEDRELKALGRIHTFRDFLETWQAVAEAGFSNLNVDLMSAIPFQSEKSWERTLHAAAGLTPPPTHISAYSLIIEEGTPFYERYGSGEHGEELPDEDTERRMYERTEEILSGYGYHRYEISNYALPGYECRHNLGYWDRREYLGIGVGAASLLDGKRWTEGEEPVVLTEKDAMEEFMFLGLRKMEGVSRRRFREQFQTKMEDVYGKEIETLCREGLLVKEEDRVRLTKWGIDVSNLVMSEFLLDEEKGDSGEKDR